MTKKNDLIKKSTEQSNYEGQKKKYIITKNKLGKIKHKAIRTKFIKKKKITKNTGKNIITSKSNILHPAEAEIYENHNNNSTTENKDPIKEANLEPQKYEHNIDEEIRQKKDKKNDTAHSHISSQKKETDI